MAILNFKHYLHNLGKASDVRTETTCSFLEAHVKVSLFSVLMYNACSLNYCRTTGCSVQHGNERPDGVAAIARVAVQQCAPAADGAPPTASRVVLRAAATDAAHSAVAVESERGPGGGERENFASARVSPVGRRLQRLASRDRRLFPALCARRLLWRTRPRRPHQFLLLAAASRLCI